MRDPMQYTKARGLALARKYLPKVTPFTDVVMIQTPEEWEQIKSQYGDFVSYRTDTRLGRPRRNIVPGTNGFTDSVPELLTRLAREDPDGAMLIMPTKEVVVPRYEYDGGFCAMLHLGERAVIETVGKGFDGHELTRRLAVHERWDIPWSCLDNLDDDLSEWWHSETDEDIAFWEVDIETYAKQRQARVEFLCRECHYDPGLVERHVPKKLRYLGATDTAVNFMSGVIRPLVRLRPALEREGMWVFSVQGNFVNSQPQVWEIYTP